MSKKAASGGGGIGIGSVIAVALSFHQNHSIGYAILHGLCSWIYVLYWWLEYGK